MGFKLDPREIGWAPYVMIRGGFGLGMFVLAGPLSAAKVGPRRAVREGSPPGDAGGLHCRGLYGSASGRAAVSRAAGSVLFRRRPAAKITSVSSTWCASRATSWARIRAVFRATPDERTATSHSAFCRSTRPTGLKPQTTKSRTVAIRYDR